MTPEQYAALRIALAALGIELPADLTDPRVTPTQLAEWHTTLEAKYQELKVGGTVNLPQLKQLRDGQNAIKAEEAGRAELVTLDAPAAVTPEPVTPEAPAPEAPEPVEPEAKGTPDATAVIGIGVTQVDPAAPPAPESEVALAMVASAQPASAKEGAGSAQRPKGLWRTASALTPEGTVGAPIPHIGNIGPQITDNAAQALRLAKEGARYGDKDGKVVVASVPPLYAEQGVDPEGMLTRGNGPDRNTEVIKAFLADHGARLAAARSGQAHTAAAPWCEPFDIIRAIPDCVDASTPFRDSLPFIPMGHGGFQFNTGISLSGVAGAVDIWTPEDQAAIDPTNPDTWKRCIPIVCPGDPPTITLDDWITACLEWQIGTDLNNPERVRDYFLKLEGLRARTTEQYLMALVDVLTINYDNSPATFRFWGGLNDLVRMVLSAFQTSGYDERTADEDGYTLYLDYGTIDTLAAGEVLSAHAKTAGTRASIVSYLMERLPMVQRVVLLRDRVPGSYGTVQANGNPRSALPAINGATADAPSFVTAHTIRVIPTAEVFAFGTGELRTGVKQDFSMARQNMVGWFAEEAIALTKYGCRPWFKFQATLCSVNWYSGALNKNVDGVTDPEECEYVADNEDPNEPDPYPFES